MKLDFLYLIDFEKLKLFLSIFYLILYICFILIINHESEKLVLLNGTNNKLYIITFVFTNNQFKYNSGI